MLFLLIECGVIFGGIMLVDWVKVEVVVVVRIVVEMNVNRDFIEGIFGDGNDWVGFVCFCVIGFCFFIGIVEGN